MSLKERLSDELRASMKDKDKIKKNTIQCIRAAVLQFEKDNKVVLDDSGVLDIISKQFKMRQDALPQYEKSGRSELIDELKTEISIIVSYLPAQLSDAELEAIVEESIQLFDVKSVKEIGKVMPSLIQKTKNRADGKRIRDILVKSLNSQ